MANKTLQDAKRQKNDEFYTQLVDIEQELKHYKQHFEGKTVLCNCDDPYESNFFRYFALNFNALKLKKLIATSYDTSPIAYTQLDIFGGESAPIPNPVRRAYKVEITEVADFNADGATDLGDVEYTRRTRLHSSKATEISAPRSVLLCSKRRTLSSPTRRLACSGNIWRR